MSKVFVMDHPLIQHKIGWIRRKETGSKEFRTLISEIAMLMCYEATRDLKLTDIEIETPICKTTVKELKGKKLAVVPILRAGLGMVDGMLAMIPAAKVGHIGLYRDPQTLKPVEYYCKLPEDCDEREVFVVDPMLATGGSSIAAIQMLKDSSVKKVLKPFNLRTLHISYIFELILFRIFCLLHHQVLVRYSSAHSISYLMLRYKCLRPDVLPALPLHLPVLQ